MKTYNILKYFLLLLLVGVVGCEEEEKPNLGKDSQWIQFDNATYAVTENSAAPLTVDVLLASDTNPNGVTIDYSVSTETPDAFQIEPSGSLTIPAGEFVGTITITPLDNAETDGNKSLTLSLNETDIPVGINGEGVFKSTAEVVITDDDCALDLKSFEGTYLANERGYCDGCYEVKITYDEANNVLKLDNVYETGGETFIELDNSDPNNPTVIYRSLELGGVILTDDRYGDGNFFAQASGEATSSFRTCDNYIDLYFRACKPDVGCFGPQRVQLTKI